MKMDFCRILAGMSLRYRDNIDIVNTERGRRYTFPEYHRLTNRIANLVRDALGLGKGDNALLILDNDNLARLQTLCDDNPLVVAGPERDGLRRDRLVGLHDINKGPGRAAQARRTKASASTAPLHPARMQRPGGPPTRHCRGVRIAGTRRRVRMPAP